MYKLLTRFLLFFTLAVLTQCPASAGLEVEINQGTVAPLPIAITDFIAEGDAERKVAKAIINVVAADLSSSGLFALVDPRAFIQSSQDANQSPNYADWRVLQAQALVVGKVRSAGQGQFVLEFRLHDVLIEQQIEGLAFTAKTSGWRRVAHKMADAIYKRVTGEEAYFDTRVVYVAESGKGGQRKTRLAIMDQDGSNHRYLTDPKRNVLSPRFSPNSQAITFMDYGADNKTPRVYVMDLGAMQFRRLGDLKSMTYAPRFSPDGNSVIMSMAESGSSSLYSMNLNTHVIRRLTFGSVIDTSACYAPDGFRVVFNSDRGGTQQLYIMNSDGTNIQRISYGGGRYATPVWSPRGDLVAFTKLYQGNFYIGVMKPDGTGERLLTQGYLVENPAWAPNGRLLIFTKQHRYGGSGLYMIDITGHNERRVPTPQGISAVGAAWSPLLPDNFGNG